MALLGAILVDHNFIPKAFMSIAFPFVPAPQFPFLISSDLKKFSIGLDSKQKATLSSHGRYHVFTRTRGPAGDTCSDCSPYLLKFKGRCASPLVDFAPNPMAPAFAITIPRWSFVTFRTSSLTKLSGSIPVAFSRTTNLIS